MKSKIRSYSSDDIDVTWDQHRCIHAEACVRNLAEVFDAKKRPWIQPDQSAADKVAETIHTCPTGALHYERKDGGAAEATPAKNDVRMMANGPLYVQGDIKLVGSDGEVLLEDTRVALCRCGASQNKPLCDNAHKEAGFRAAGTADGLSSQDAVEASGLTITFTENGPMHVEGNFTIESLRGEALATQSDAWMCRCGGSENKPFCDSTHRKIGFEG